MKSLAAARARSRQAAHKKGCSASLGRRPRISHAHKQVVEPGGAVYTLHPGDVVCANQGDRLETLLGSCVAIVLTDPRRTVAAMCHFVHPRRAVAEAQETSAFADVALESLFAMLEARGIAPGLCEAYVYGGGNMFPDLIRNAHVGNANASWALDALEGHGIRVLFQDLGGNAYRRFSWTVGHGAPHVVAVEV